MMAAFASRQLEYWESSNMLHAYGSPLPRQGEEEGERLSEATRVDSETPHLNPLPFSKGRREDARSIWPQSRQSERGGDELPIKTRN